MIHSKWRRRLRWGAIIASAVLGFAVIAVWRVWSGRHIAQWQMLQNIIQAECEGMDQHSVQPLGWQLAILGRDDEIRRMDFHPQLELPPLDVDPQDLNLDVVAWRGALKAIANEHRVVMIMEDHFVSKHREMIGATLPMLRDAGFTHYAAEAIGESAQSLHARGFPAIQTGYYVSDPQFGNVIRTALKLRFEILGYDFRPFTHEGREEYAASVLAGVLKDNAASKLIVHAGHAHVLKHKTDIGQRWLASILWEKTGIEPFTIWQWSSMHDGHEHRVVAEALASLGEFDEPVLLMPPPTTESGLRNVPRVDAILVHPPDQSTAPEKRTLLFPDSMVPVSGRWQTRRWPVVVAAYKRGEPTSAIPLDQVMLRDGEQDFVLWLPKSTGYDIVVFDQYGVLSCTAKENLDSVVVRAK
ncbi:MAG: hypothetical protein AAGD07_08185 [Planctomycetota bacterium]